MERARRGGAKPERAKPQLKVRPNGFAELTTPALRATTLLFKEGKNFGLRVTELQVLAEAVQ